MIAKTMKKKTILKESLPSGYKFAIDLPADVDPELARIAFKAILGGFVGLTNTHDEDVRRTFMIRFVVSIIAEANSAIHSAQMANRLQDSSPKNIIEQLLKSLDKDKK